MREPEIPRELCVPEAAGRCRQCDDLEQVFRTNLFGVLVIEPDGRFAYVNDAAVDLLQCSRELFVNSRYHDQNWDIADINGHSVPCEDQPFAKVMATGQPVRGAEYAIALADGPRRYLRVNAAPIRGPNDAIERVVIALEDISESFHARRHLEQVYEWFRLAQEATRFGLWQWDVDRDRGQWDVVSWQLLGHDGDQASTVLTYEDWLQLIHPDDREAASHEFRVQLQSGDSLSQELRYRRADGRWQWIQHRGKVVSRTPEGQPLMIAGTHTDVQQLKEAEERLRQIAESIEEVVWLRTSDALLYVNRAYERIWGRSRELLYADPSGYLEGVHPDDRRRVETAFARAQQTPVAFDETYRIVRPDGTIRWVRARSYPVDHEQGRTVGTIVDITDAKKAQDILERRATIDPLTGLWNRSQFDIKFRDALDRCRRYHSPASLILLDIDHFKRVNDTFGHDVGDAVLREIARRLGAILRSPDALARWGGEEFVALLPETNIEHAAGIAQRLRECVCSRDVETVGRITASLGVTALRPDDPTTRAVLRRADSALYRAKAAGRNQVVTIYA
ncbi:diguanylate cyclase [Aquisalimonas sp.]|uniref:sensor domain-containing diguanylate cyclase n=1 Tax=Aquisalimonas sp. TaxID=1872621 RepID=UPI0025BA2A98|nr:diguanylate cyclase [Aquisalimonas sp.]